MNELEDLSLGHIDDPSAAARSAPARALHFIERRLPGLQAGQLRIVLPSGEALTIVGRAPGPQATVILNRWRALRRLSLGGAVGFAESFVARDWTSPDLVALLRLAARNLGAWNRAIRGSRLSRSVARLRHFLRANTRRGSRRNIVAHYDLGNDFYRLWLDGAMQYSSAIFDDGDETLEAAQARKLARIAHLLRLNGGESVLEIGCGWGGLAEHPRNGEGSQCNGANPVARTREMGARPCSRQTPGRPHQRAPARLPRR